MEVGAEGRNPDTEGQNLARSPELRKIRLADGKDYDLTPLNLNILCEMEEKFGKPFNEVLSGGKITPIRYLLFIQLKDKYPFTGEEQVGNLVNLDVLKELNKALGVG